MPEPLPSLDTVFCTAIGIASAPERDAYIAQACGNDAALRAQVENLVDAHFRAGNFLESPDPQLHGTTDEPTPSAHAGTVIGPYKLLEQIGEGGMGTVWMAQQTEPVKRLVALKLIKAGMDSKAVIARFEAERQALALMDHPNIAKVLDAGTTSAGRPYFVMDLVKGVPITKYCDEHHLTPRQRLELFIPVCNAIQHAHQKGIIHRDLKPSNVLVALYDGKPVPKVIDFGVAKAAGQPLTEKTLVTGFGAIVGTLEYMSPEQAEINQLDIDTRSDIYSLGVLLYELLTGSPPFSRKELEKAGMIEMLRVIREQEPSKPSTKLSSSDALPTLSANRGTEPAKLTKLVRGELDWIVMKALEKDRNRRYETANGFAMDVQRYLADEAVLACPPSVGYRLRKFARRNKARLAVAALVLIFLGLLGSGVGWAVRDRAAREAEAARQQAERNAKVAGQVESVFAEVDRLETEQKWPEALAAARRAEAALAGGEADAETAQRVRERLKDLVFIDRLERIRMHRATIVEGKFDYTGADRDYARTFRDHGVDVEELPVETSIDRLNGRPALALPLAAALDDWVFVRRAVSGRDGAGWKRLVAVARGIDPESLRDRLRSILGQPISPAVQDELNRLAGSIEVRAHHPATLVNLARTLERVKATDCAIRLLRDAQYVYPGDFWLNFELGYALHNQQDHEGGIRYYNVAVGIRPNSAAAHNNLGTALIYKGEVDEAIRCYRKVIELDSKYPGAYLNLGQAYHGQKQWDQANAAYRKAIEIDPKYAVAYLEFGRALQDQKRWDEAIAVYRELTKVAPKSAYSASVYVGDALVRHGMPDEAVAVYRKLIEDDPKDKRAYIGLGQAIESRPTWDPRRLEEAAASIRQGIKLIPQDQHYQYYYLGCVLNKQKKHHEAAEALRKSIDINSQYALAHIQLGVALAELGQDADAIDSFRHAIKLAPKDVASYARLAGALRRQGKPDDAIAAYRQGLKHLPNDVNLHHQLAQFLWKERRLAEAADGFRQTIRLSPSRVYVLYYNLGRVLNENKQPKEAVDALRQAVELNPEFAAAHYQLGVALAELGQDADAIGSFRQAIKLAPKDTASYARLAGALRRQGKPDDVIAAYRQGLEHLPDDVYLHHALAHFFWKERRLAEAADGFRQTIKLNPSHVYVQYYNLGRVLNENKQPKEAVDALRQAIDNNPKFAPAHYQLGLALAALAKDTDAIDKRLLAEASAAFREYERLTLAPLREALRLKPQDASARDKLAWCLNNLSWHRVTHAEPVLRDPDRAVSLAREAAELKPQEGTIRNTLGAALYRAGRWKDAIAALEKSMELRKGGDSNDWFFVAMARWRLGDKDKAREFHDRAVQWMDKHRPTNEELGRFRAEATELLELKEKK